MTTEKRLKNSKTTWLETTMGISKSMLSQERRHIGRPGQTKDNLGNTRKITVASVNLGTDFGNVRLCADGRGELERGPNAA